MEESVRVLVVDDNPGDTRLIEAMLAEEDGASFGTQTAGRLSEAIAALGRGAFDVVLLDLGLPDSQGLDTFREVRRVGGGIPVVVMTGLDDHHVALQAVREGAQDYLVKGKVDAALVARSVRYAVERHRLGSALRASETRLRTVTDQNLDAILVVDQSGIVRFANPAAEGVFRQRQDELRGTRFGCVAPGREAEQLCIPQPNGEAKVVEMRVAAIEWEGEPACLASLRDITERKRIEDRLTSQERLASLGRLGGGIAHRFNNLLLAILANAEFAVEALPERSQSRRDILEAMKAAQAAEDLVKQILAFSGQGKFVSERLVLTDLIREMAPLLEVAGGGQGSLRHRLDGELPAVDADPSQVRQMIVNLVTNAAEASETAHSPITLTTWAETCDGRCLARTYLPENTVEGRYVVLEVADTGRGMDEGIRRRMFDPFFSTKFTGRGLGLAAVLGIVRAHDGTLTVESRPGQGTTVRVYLPVASHSSGDG